MNFLTNHKTALISSLSHDKPINQTDCRFDTTAKGNFIWANNSTDNTSIVKSGTCISTTRDPATKRVQNSLFVRRVWCPVFKSLVTSQLADTIITRVS